MKRAVVLLLVLAFAFSAPAFANQVLTNAESTDYVTKAPAMLLRGVGNIVLSPLEVIENGYKMTMEGRPIVGTFEGTVRGVYLMLDRAGRGVWDVITFWAPNYNGEPPDRELSFLAAN
ncbi:MAG: exosortase system-associated protein, TIGR04073 family [Candidatus Omnitrophica bacterium]|nr:exosortase system-associated protein, TIGR04073 family [Candidatus Omnitrophota bacterium]